MSLEDVFGSFCAFGAGGNAKAELDGGKFAKLCKDTKLIDKKFTTTDVDLLFSKVKPKGGRVIDFQTFQSRCIPEIATKKGVAPDDVVRAILEGAPTSSGTVAEQVRLHDDKEQYTGVYSRGGPTNVDTGTSDLKYITNRTEADVRGVQQRQSRGSVGGAPAAAPKRESQAGPEHASDAGRINPLLRRLDEETVSQALSSLLSWQERGIPALDEAIAQLRAAQGGRKSSATGSAEAPAPAAAAPAPAAPAPHPPPQARKQSTQSTGGRKQSTGAAGPVGGLLDGDAVNWTAVQEVFNAFCAFGAGRSGSRSGAEMDNAKFAKFCKETGIVDKHFTPTDADLVFSKVKPKGGRTVDFATFKSGALVEIAARKKCTVEQVVGSMRGGPQSSGTVADQVALHDDKENYTGVYKAGGPSTVDTGTSDLRFITNRAEADVRGVQT
eukprot:TRINITY_DN14307_c0_g1_i1.p1 TRINITY_DN14307_c0_g1~~TRINITY_DN14307_c0_g1_i1.p1  ORF type:complete len:440 (+),score=142.74 TRINITY_DN14307_c0_g1_i1:73-1392(+)